jgi:hypothetical protein
MDLLFGKTIKENERLAAQTLELEKLHGMVRDAALEVEQIKKQLLTKANGALYPHLPLEGKTK